MTEIASRTGTKTGDDTEGLEPVTPSQSPAEDKQAKILTALDRRILRHERELEAGWLPYAD